LQYEIDKMTVTEKYINPFTDFGVKKIFQQLFDTAEIAKFSLEEKEHYEESLKRWSHNYQNYSFQ
jgi:hypothetical protein